MHRALLVTAVLLFVSGCASGPPPASDAEKNEAIKAHFLCLVNAAAKMDDHRSDAATIAIAIEPMCAREFEVVIETFSRAAPNSVAAGMLRQRLMADQLQTATGAVLSERQH